MKKGMKARPHDIEEVMKLCPELIEIHASYEDLEKDLPGKWDIPLVLHAPEYCGQELMDASSQDEVKRLAAQKVIEKAVNTARRWGAQFKGTPKVVVHPGGWSNEPLKKFERDGLYDAFYKTISSINTNGVDFLVENMPPFPMFWGGQWNCNIFMDPKECRDFCTGNGYGLTLDLCHLSMYVKHIKNMTMAEAMRILKPVVAHIHFSGAEGVDKEGLQVGEGDLDLKECLDYLGGLNVGWVPEVWMSHKDNFAGLKLAWERMDAFLLGGTK
jgi:N-acetylneuraminate synthase